MEKGAHSLGPCCLWWDREVSPALTSVGRHQQVQGLLGQIGPHGGDLLPQCRVTLVLLRASWAAGGGGRGGKGLGAALQPRGEQAELGGRQERHSEGAGQGGCWEGGWSELSLQELLCVCGGGRGGGAVLGRGGARSCRHRPLSKCTDPQVSGAVTSDGTKPLPLEGQTSAHSEGVTR